jgi:hypothetical protein
MSTARALKLLANSYPRLSKLAPTLMPHHVMARASDSSSVRQVIGILGHRIDVVSIPCCGSRSTIFVARAGFERGTEDPMSVATHINHAPEAAFVRVYDAQAARRQFEISVILILILTFAAFAVGLLVRFDIVKSEPVTGAPSRANHGIRQQFDECQIVTGTAVGG